MNIKNIILSLILASCLISVQSSKSIDFSYIEISDLFNQTIKQTIKTHGNKIRYLLIGSILAASAYVINDILSLPLHSQQHLINYNDLIKIHPEFVELTNGLTDDKNNLVIHKFESEAIQIKFIKNNKEQILYFCKLDENSKYQLSKVILNKFKTV